MMPLTTNLPVCAVDGWGTPLLLEPHDEKMAELHETVMRSAKRRMFTMVPDSFSFNMDKTVQKIKGVLLEENARHLRDA
jgi:hypothetical protein